MTTKRTGNYTVRDFERKYGTLTLGRFLSSWRLSEEISQKEFAEQLGISPANLCDIEKGRKGVSIDKAVEIARAIGYSPTILVELALQEQVRSSGLDYTVKVKKRVA
jgi:transcriptional regulator with XRE-family HTH domain